MSYTTMFIFDDDGDVCGDSEYRNAWGFGPMIWGALLARYRELIPGLGPEPSMMDWPKIWETDKQTPLPLQPWERNVLSATYDHAVIRGADLERMADSFERFEEAHAKPESACSLKKIAARMRDLAAGKETKFARPDICFQGTSVSEDMWLVYDDEADEDAEPRPYNIKRDAEHWYIEISPVTPGAPR